MWAAAKGIIIWAKSKNAKKLVDELADNMDKAADEGFKKESEPVQESVVASFLIPLSDRLMRENPARLAALYAAALKRINPEPAPPSPAGQNFGPKK